MKRNNMLLFAAAAALTLSALTGCTVRTAVESEPIRQTGTNGAAVSRLAAVDQGTQTAKAIRYPEIELTYDRNGRILELEGVNDRTGIQLADFRETVGKDSKTTLQTLICALYHADFFRSTQHLILELERETVDPKAGYQEELAACIREAEKACGLPENTVIVKTEPPAASISAEQAKAIALAELQRRTKTYDRVVCELDDGVYEVEFTAGRYSYEYEIDAATGAVLDEEIDVDDDIETPAASISAEQAKAIALAELQRRTKTYDRVVCELDDGVYEVEFTAGRYSYEYEIDAATGAVLDEEIDDEWDD